MDPSKMVPGGGDPPAVPPVPEKKPEGEGGEQKQTVPVAELIAMRQRAQAAEKVAADRESEIKKRDAEKLTKEEQLAVRLKDLEPFEAEAKESRSWFERERDAALAALPADLQAQLKPELSDLHPRKALALVKAAGLSARKPEPTAPVVRGGPSSRLPDGAPRTFAEWKALPQKEREKYPADDLPDT
jgi:hypothetical protein